MSIPDEFRFDKEGEVVRFPHFRHYFLTLVILLVALLSFGIGRLTGSDRAGVSINMNDQVLMTNDQLDSSVAIGNSAPGAVTASSQGTRYYYSHCGNSISEKNRVTFATATMAEQAGYALAKNCQPK